MRYADLEIDLLRAFVAVADAGGFSAAAPLVGRSQSAVSQKVLRLEGILGQRMFDRHSRSIGLTLEGEKLLAAARQMIEFNDKVVRELREPKAEGTLRLAISEDAIPRQLPAILARFAHAYPRVQVEVATGLSCNLVAEFDEGKFDAVIAKKDRTTQRGRTIWREALTWMASTDFVTGAKPIRLVLLPMPCSYRALMIERLSQANLDWRVSCTASSLLGAKAAVEGGLGVTALGRSFLGPGMRALTTEEGWPALPHMEIVILSDGSQTAELVRPLVDFLSNNLVVSGDDAPEHIGRGISYLHS